MGEYVAIRGWLQCDDKQLAFVRQLIDSDPDQYSGGWAFPAQRINWTGHAFYGADIRDSAVDWFLDQLRDSLRSPRQTRTTTAYGDSFLSATKLRAWLSGRYATDRYTSRPPARSSPTSTANTASLTPSPRRR